MTDKSTMSTLKAQWVILKDTSASLEDRCAAYKIIDTLQNQHKDDEGFSVVPLENTRYKVFKDIETAKAAPKQTTEAVAPSPAGRPISGFKPLEKFDQLSEAEQKKFRTKAIKVFELKNLVEQTASELFPYYNNPMSVGQVVNILLQE